jgi:hypothetical protein
MTQRRKAETKALDKAKSHTCSTHPKKVETKARETEK